MATQTHKDQKARFDTRLSKEQKVLFERAATLGGFRSLTDFVVLTVQEKAKEILAENDTIIASERDKEIFFDAIMNAEEPNNDLLSAARQYKEIIS